MTADVLKKALERPQNARSRLTNGPTWYSLMLDQSNKANRAKCVTTPHGSDPTQPERAAALRAQPDHIDHTPSRILNVPSSIYMRGKLLLFNLHG